MGKGSTAVLLESLEVMKAEMAEVMRAETMEGMKAGMNTSTAAMIRYSNREGFLLNRLELETMAG